MKLAGAIIAIIAGVFSVMVAGYTLVQGQTIEALDTSVGKQITTAGWVGLGSSFVVIVLGVVALTTQVKRIGTLLMLAAINGVLFANLYNAAFMGLAVMGAILIMIGSKQEEKTSAASSVEVATELAPVSVAPAIAHEPSPATKKTSMGLLIGLAIVFVIATFVIAVKWQGASDAGHKGEAVNASQDEFSKLEKAQPSPLEPIGELEELFSFGSDSTDIQREKKAAEIKGQVVDWTLTVYEVQREGDGYQIQTGSDNEAGTLINLSVRNSQERAYVEELKTGSPIHVKGIISDVVLRTINLQPAILMVESAPVPQANTVPPLSQPQERSPIDQVDRPAQAVVAIDDAKPVTVKQGEAAATEATSENAMSEDKPSFDCSQAMNTVEKTICASPDLAKLDVQVVEAYKDALKVGTADANNRLVNSQREWIRSRNQCQTVKCIADVYEQRHRELAPWDYE